jgi:DNA-binding Lrp family transcriptional regulator
MREIPCTEPLLPFTLKDPKEFALKGDLFDILILKEMEKDAAISFADIGKKIGLTKAGVRYHYEEHVIKLGLLEGFEVELIPFNEATSDFYFFSFMFPDMDKMAKFALSLLSKPFVFIVGKILGQPGIISQLYLPKKEFANFKDCLSLLVRKGWLKTYDYVIQHTGEWSRQTISYEYFKDGKWIYEHERHLSTLRNTVGEINSKEFPEIS